MIKYTPWNPIEGLDGYFWFENLVDDVNLECPLILRFSSEETKRVLEVSFRVPLSYQKTSSFDFVNAELVYRGVFLKIEDSPYLQWFLDMSHNNWSDHKVINYSFRTNNYVIDVLSAHEVTAKWLD